MPPDATTNEESKFDQKLGRILTAAAEVFAEEGYDRASIRTVVERAEVSIAGVVSSTAIAKMLNESTAHWVPRVRRNLDAPRKME